MVLGFGVRIPEHGLGLLGLGIPEKGLGLRITVKGLGFRV